MSAPLASSYCHKPEASVCWFGALWRALRVAWSLKHSGATPRRKRGWKLAQQTASAQGDVCHDQKSGFMR